MSWPTKPLSEVADFLLGKMLDQKKNKGDPLPYLANVNVRWGSFDLADLREMRFEPHELDRYGLKQGDIVMCEGGEPGRCAIWNDRLPNMMFQKALHRIRPRQGVDNRFLYYTFLNKGRSNGFQGLFTGATIKHLPKEKLAKVEVSTPPLETQRKIADVLGAYDDLIENNRRRIELLEEAARILYREWFVHFRFPGHEHVKVVDGVPAGWQRTSISELSCFLSRGITPTYDDEASGIVINQKCIRASKLTLTEARHQSKRVPDAKLVRLYDVLINSTGTGTLGRVAQNYLSLPNLTVDSHVTIARPKPDVPPCWYGLTLMLKQDFIATLGRGATNQTELSKDDVGAITTIIPAADILKDFENQVSQIIKQITVLSAQSEELAKARDLLLPRLMDGRLEV